MEGAPDGVPLRCLGGRPGPARLTADVGELLALPLAVKERFWDVILPYLHPAPTDEQAARVEALRGEHGLAAEALVGPIRAARFLIVEGARAGLDDDAFVADLSSLSRTVDVREIVGILLPCFRRAAPPLRSEIVARTLADHGKLVSDVHWRVDRILGSERGSALDAAVAVLTFDYRDGARDDRVTMQFMPEQLIQLLRACEEMLADQRREG